MKRLRLFLYITALGIFAATIFASDTRVRSFSFIENLLAQDATQPILEIASYPGYPATGEKRLGVWNNGEAALWDLDIIDYFRIFGAKERARGYKPEQPIKFSHVTHVQKNKMECQYCHWTVAKSPYAAIPEVSTCMGCHKMVKGTTPEQQEEIKKVEDFYNQGTQIPWLKVHVMPSYVFFNHKRHVKAGVGCQECHGQIPEMPQVERATSMKMGWCIDCHREKGTSIDCYACHH